VNAAATLTVVSVLVAVFAGLLSRRVALAPGSGEQRWFSVVVLASAGYALCNLSTTLPTSPPSVFLLAGVQIGLLSILVWGWVRFSQEFVGVAPGPVEQAMSTLLLAGAPVMAAPGLLYSGRVIERTYPPLDVLYRQAAPTAVGDAVFAFLSVVAAAVLVRLVGGWRRGVRHAGPVALAYAIMLVFAVCDALNTVFVLPLPFLLDLGFAPAALAIGWKNTCRLVESTRALERLRGELESTVQARTLELSAAMERLHQAEKLAALGRFANGVAHEVNNPAAVVNAALGFLADDPDGRLGPEEREAIGDARDGMRQITSLVRRLVDAGRLATPPGLAVADVPTAVANVVHLQGAALRGRVRVDTADAAGATVRLRQDALEGAIETLLRNAMDASAPDADAIEIRAERRDGRVRVTVADHGSGMTAEVLGRAFDPFFTTKPLGRGTGLGLSVARGLVQASGGSLVLESAPGAGTRAVLELPELRRAARGVAEPPGAHAAAS
jgi:signal transduction histidine kinase